MNKKQYTAPMMKVQQIDNETLLTGSIGLFDEGAQQEGMGKEYDFEEELDFEE